MSHHNIHAINAINISIQSGTLKGTHTGDSNHVCDVCGTRFACGYNLKRHTKSVHMEEKNHQCDICNKHFRQKKYLDAHALKHSGENPHHCLVCNKSFSVKRYLKKKTTSFTIYEHDKCLGLVTGIMLMNSHFIVPYMGVAAILLTSLL